MTSLFGPRRRAEEFAARADEAASGSRVHRDGAPGPHPDTDALLDLVSALRGVGAADDLAVPGEAFSLDLRERLVTEAATVLVAQRADPATGTHRAVSGSALPRATTRGWARRRRRLATATATVAILMGGTAGMASAAQDSLPGQALYPVKRGLEKAAVTLSGSSVDRGRELLTQASGRLDEVQGLMDAGAAERTQIPGTLDTFNEQAREGAGLLISSYESTDDETAMVTLRNFAASSMDTIEDLATTAPTNEALTGLGDAAVLMHAVDTAADQVCPGCSDLPTLPSSDVLTLTNATGTVGFPGAGTVLDAGVLVGATGDPTTDGTLAPLLPGLGLLGVPGAPTETATEGQPTDTSTGETTTGETTGETTTGETTTGETTTGETTTGGSTAGADPGTETPETPTPTSEPTTTDPTPPSDPTPIDPTTPSDPPPSDPATPTDPPVTDPPATDPPATDPPATEPPVVNSPDPEPTPSTAPVEDPGAEQPTDGGDQGTEAPTGDTTPADGQP